MPAELLRRLLGGAIQPDRNEAGAAHRLAAKQAVDDAVIVDGAGDRLARLLHRQRLVEGGFVGQRHVDEVEALQPLDAHVLVALQRRDLFGDQVERSTDVAALDRQQLRRAVAHMAHDHMLEMHRPAEVVRVARQQDLRAAGPADHRERAGAGRVLVQPLRRLVGRCWRSAPLVPPWASTAFRSITPKFGPDRMVRIGCVGSTSMISTVFGSTTLIDDRHW